MIILVVGICYPIFIGSFNLKECVEARLIQYNSEQLQPQRFSPFSNSFFDFTMCSMTVPQDWEQKVFLYQDEIYPSDKLQAFVQSKAATVQSRRAQDQRALSQCSHGTGVIEEEGNLPTDPPTREL